MKPFLIACATCVLSVPSLFSTPLFQSFDVPGSSSTEAWSVNNAGFVAGYYTTATATLGFIYNPLADTYQTISGLSGWSDVQVYAINDNGDVAGAYRDSSNNTHGFVDVAGHYTTIDGPGAQYGTQVWGFNKNGQLAVTYATGNFANAYRWTPDGHGGYTVQNLSIAVDGTFAGGLNNNGDMAGYYQTPNYGGFVWKANGSSSTFNVPGDGGTTQALGIADNGVVAGAFFDGSHIAGYVLRDGIFSELNPPTSTYTYVTDVNNNGVVSGWYFTADNRIHGFLAATAPEPASLGTAAFGCIGLLALARPKHRS